MDGVPGGDSRATMNKPIRKQEAPLKPEYYGRGPSIKDQGERPRHGLHLPAARHAEDDVGRRPHGFLVSPDVTRILFDRNDYAPRRIYTDGRAWPQLAPDDSTFPGFSIGKWVEETAMAASMPRVETRHVRGPRTWDQSGMPMADDDEGVIKERLSSTRTIPTSCTTR